MMKRSLSVLKVLFLIVTCACTESGGHWQHYRISALSEAKERNWTIFLHFHEQGNSSSDKQKEILETIIKEATFKKVGAYRVIMGAEKGLEEMFHITSPATVLVLKGGAERGRSVGSSDENQLRALLLRGL